MHIHFDNAPGIGRHFNHVRDADRLAERSLQVRTGTPMAAASVLYRRHELEIILKISLGRHKNPQDSATYFGAQCGANDPRRRNALCRRQVGRLGPSDSAERRPRISARGFQDLVRKSLERVRFRCTLKCGVASPARLGPAMARAPPSDLVHRGMGNRTRSPRGSNREAAGSPLASRPAPDTSARNGRTTRRLPTTGYRPLDIPGATEAA